MIPFFHDSILQWIYTPKLNQNVDLENSFETHNNSIIQNKVQFESFKIRDRILHEKSRK